MRCLVYRGPFFLTKWYSGAAPLISPILIRDFIATSLSFNIRPGRVLVSYSCRSYFFILVSLTIWRGQEVFKPKPSFFWFCRPCINLCLSSHIYSKQKKANSTFNIPSRNYFRLFTQFIKSFSTFHVIVGDSVANLSDTINKDPFLSVSKKIVLAFFEPL